jgi:mitogen-activated protein kinase kinase 3
MGLWGKQSKSREKVPNIDFGQTSFTELQNELSHRSPNAQICSAETEEIRPLFAKLFQDGDTVKNCNSEDFFSRDTVAKSIGDDSASSTDRSIKFTPENGLRSSSATGPFLQDDTRGLNHSSRVSTNPVFSRNESRRNTSDNQVRVDSNSTLQNPSSKDGNFHGSRSFSQGDKTQNSRSSPQPAGMRAGSGKEKVNLVLSPVSPFTAESPKPRVTGNNMDDDLRKGYSLLPSPKDQKSATGSQSTPHRVSHLQRANSIVRVAQRASLKRIHSTLRPRGGSETPTALSPKSDTQMSPKRVVGDELKGNDTITTPATEDTQQPSPQGKLSTLLSSNFIRRPSMKIKGTAPGRGSADNAFQEPSGNDVLKVSSSPQKLENEGSELTTSTLEPPRRSGSSSRSSKLVQISSSSDIASISKSPPLLDKPSTGQQKNHILFAENREQSGIVRSTAPARSKSAPSTRAAAVWENLETEDFSDVGMFGLEAATQRDFPSHLLQTDDPHHNSPSNPSIPDNEFDIDIRPENVSPTQQARGDARNEQSKNQKKTESLFGVKPTGNARKRPPPLQAQEAPTSSSPSQLGSSSPHTGVFRSNGDFSTGGFLITSEGMVGKPDKATRMDSDDGPTTGVPQSIGNLLIVRSLAEFRKGPTLGAGAAGRVYLAIHEPSGRSMAIKVVNVYDEAKRNQLLKELDTLVSYASRFLVRFHGAFYEGTGAVHIALEFMDGGCLSSTVQQFGAIPERVTQMIAVDCLRALRFLHRHNVIHRDLKTANILLSRRLLCAKVSDFGLARDLNEGVSKVDTFVGTVAYMSPERLQGGQYTYASDIWALGISIAECLLGRYPFDRPQSYFDYIDASMSKDMLGKRGADGLALSPAVVDFVSLCTHSDPLRRPTAAQLLTHPWITNTKRDVPLFRQWMDELAAARSRSEKGVKSVQSIRSFLGNAR